MAWANDIICTNQSMASDVDSDIVDMKNIYMVAVQCVYTGTPAGVLQMEFSNNGVDWISPTGAQKNLVGDPGSFFIDYTDTACRWMRVNYYVDSGSGTLNVWFSSKGV